MGETSGKSEKKFIIHNGNLTSIKTFHNNLTIIMVSTVSFGQRNNPPFTINFHHHQDHSMVEKECKNLMRTTLRYYKKYF